MDELAEKILLLKERIKEVALAGKEQELWDKASPLHRAFLVGALEWILDDLEKEDGKK